MLTDTGTELQIRVVNFQGWVGSDEYHDDIKKVRDEASGCGDLHDWGKQPCYRFQSPTG